MAHPSETSDCKFCGFDGNRHTMVITEGWDEPQGGRIFYWLCQMCGHEATFAQQSEDMAEIAKNGFSDYTITNPLLLEVHAMPRKKQENEAPEPENQPGEVLQLENVYITIIIKTPKGERVFFQQVENEYVMRNMAAYAFHDTFLDDIPL